jgi:AcrR family transcriptional regulator
MNQVNQAETASRRSRGRPLETGQQDLREKILDTAEQMFTESGYAATPIRRIADSCGVNPALVHYYFGNKRDLVQATLERALAPLIKALANFKDDQQAGIGDISHLLISMAAEHPNIPRLMTREVLLPGGEMQDYFIENMAPRLGGALPELVKREKSKGQLRDDLDPDFAALMILSMSFFPFIARTLAEQVLDIDFTNKGIEMLNQRVASLLDKGMSK